MSLASLCIIVHCCALWSGIVGGWMGKGLFICLGRMYGGCMYGVCVDAINI